MQQLVKIFIVALTLFGTSAPCFCWMQMVSMPGCHVVEQMENCCCSKDAAMDHDMPVNDLAVLPSMWHVPSLDTAALAVSDVSFFMQSSSSSFTARNRKDSLRAPPDLYLLHAAFLI